MAWMKKAWGVKPSMKLDRYDPRAAQGLTPPTNKKCHTREDPRPGQPGQETLRGNVIGVLAVVGKDPRVANNRTNRETHTHKKRKKFFGCVQAVRNHPRARAHRG